MADLEPDPTQARDQLEDRAVRTRVFYGLLALTCLLIWAAHRLQASYSYPLNTTDPATGRPRSGSVHYGSFGAYLAELDPASPGDCHPIVLLGNSVYQACQIPERMQALANDRGDGVEFFNLAQTGAGFHDHFAQMLKSLAVAPELLVVTFVNLAFTPDFVGTSLPRFRTDSDQMLFDRDVILQVPFSFLRREFTIATASDSIVSSLFPYKRMEVIVRLDVDRWLYWRCMELLALDPVALRRYFPLPSLNLTQDWVDRREVPRRTDVRAQPYPELQAIVAEFLQVCRANGVPVLFLRLESGPGFPPDVLPAIEEVCRAFPAARVVDLQPVFVPEHFVDQVHPEEHERDAYARRHYDVILRAFRELRAASPGAGEKK